MTVTVSVVVVSYNTRCLLHDSVQRISESLDGIPHEVIVVDNGSPDGTAEFVARELPGVRLVANHENLYYTRAVNQGLRAAVGQFILIVNSDVLCSPDTFRRMFQYLHVHPDVGAVSPVLVDAEGIPETCFCRTRTYESFVLNYTFLRHFLPGRTRRINAEIGMEGVSRSDVRDVEVVVDMSLLVRREALEDIGLFDEDFKLYFCDDDVSIRIRKSGWRVVFLGDVANRHDRHQSVGQLAELRRIRIFRDDAYVYARKHFGWIRASVLWLLMQMTTGLRAMRLQLFNANAPAPRAGDFTNE